MKKSRKERKEEERRILAELDEAVEKERAEEEPPKEERTGFYDSTQPKRLHCRRCNSVMENGACPTCGYKVYVPMDEKKRKKIRAVVTVVCLAVFLVLFLLLQTK